MFKQFYTTQMSASKRQLQMRFLKMRSKTGRKAKILSAVVSVIVIAATLCATVVMATTGSDGLEHWDVNQVYYLSGMKFSIDTTNSSLPDWAQKLVLENGNIDISLGKYAFRDQKGDIRTTILGTFSGEGEPLTLINHICTQNFGESYIMYFSGSMDGLTNDFDIQPDDGRHIRITFALDEQKRLIHPEVEFFTLAPNMEFNAQEKAKSILKPKTVDLIGDFDQLYLEAVNFISDSPLFLEFEKKHYKNKTVAGIDINVISADNDEIVIRSDTKLDKIKNISVFAYNSSGYRVSTLNGLEMDENGYKAKIYNNDVQASVTPDGKTITLFPPKATGTHTFGLGNYSDENCYGQFISGNTYRIELGMYDENDSLLYRWQDSITIK